MYFLKLKFEGARLYLNNKGTSNKHIQNYSNPRGTMSMYKEKSSTLGNFVEPIAINHISNVIHSLFGKRPVPYHRMVAYSRDEYLYNKAKESYLYIRPQFIDKMGNEVFVDETMNVTKSDYNSYHKKVNIGWYDLKYYMMFDSDKIKDVKDYFGKVLSEKVTEKIPLYIYLGKLRDRIDDVDKKFFMERGITSIYYVINDDAFSGGLLTGQGYGKHAKLINKAIHKCKVLDGEILVPVTEEDLDRLDKYSTGTCTILDGGYVTIEHIVKQSRMRKRELETKYRKVSDLSQKLTYELK